MGVRLINLKGDDAVLSIARNPEGSDDEAEAGEAPAADAEATAEVAAETEQA
jgi:hypothetical protein